MTARTRRRPAVTALWWAGAAALFVVAAVAGYAILVIVGK